MVPRVRECDCAPYYRLAADRGDSYSNRDFALRMVKVLKRTIQKQVHISSCQQMKAIHMVNIMMFALGMVKVLHKT